MQIPKKKVTIATATVDRVLGNLGGAWDMSSTSSVNREGKSGEVQFGLALGSGNWSKRANRQ